MPQQRGQDMLAKAISQSTRVGEIQHSNPFRPAAAWLQRLSERSLGREALRAGVCDRIPGVAYFSSRRRRRDAIRPRVLSTERSQACGSARSCIRRCSPHSRMAPASSSIKMARPRRARIAYTAATGSGGTRMIPASPSVHFVSSASDGQCLGAPLFNGQQRPQDPRI
jgi:hypothetical protein